MMARVDTTQVEEIGKAWLPDILSANNWVATSRALRDPLHLRKVGTLDVRASVDVTPLLDVYLHIAFRGPGLSPMQAADCLEAFLKGHLALFPNSEWLVEVDSKNWIHFTRKWVGECLKA